MPRKHEVSRRSNSQLSNSGRIGSGSHSPSLKLRSHGPGLGAAQLAFSVMVVTRDAQPSIRYATDVSCATGTVGLTSHGDTATGSASSTLNRETTAAQATWVPPVGIGWLTRGHAHRAPQKVALTALLRYLARLSCRVTTTIAIAI